MFFTPQPGEVAWARGVAGSDKHLLALLVLAKCFGRLGYFPALADAPAAVVEHLRRDLGLAEGTAAVYASARTAERHRDMVRQRLGVVRDPAGARKVAAEAIYAEHSKPSFRTERGASPGRVAPLRSEYRVRACSPGRGRCELGLPDGCAGYCLGQLVAADEEEGDRDRA